MSRRIGTTILVVTIAAGLWQTGEARKKKAGEPDRVKVQHLLLSFKGAEDSLKRRGQLGQRVRLGHGSSETVRFETPAMSATVATRPSAVNASQIFWPSSPLPNAVEV